MYDIKWIRENPHLLDRGLSRRGLPPQSEWILKVDQQRRKIIKIVEDSQAQRRTISDQVNTARKNGDSETATQLASHVARLRDVISKLEVEEKWVGDLLVDELAELPNLPLDEVPTGPDAGANVVYRRFGEPRQFNFVPKEHFELGEALGQMDFELAAKLSGARFVVLQNGLARLERALGQFMLNVHTGDEHGYTEVNPPFLVRNNVMFGTAQLPKFVEDQFLATALPVSSRFWLEGGKEPKRDESFIEVRERYRQMFPEDASHPLWLIPTAEVPLTNLVRESIVDEATLPRRYTACTPCFRAEAGAAGKDTRGMIRQHQFTKVELVSITTPEQSKAEHERMLNCAEEILKKLDLHYRVITLCSGDMGFASQKTYDIEVWLPGQGLYREISSCSVCGEFQARRMNARYRGKDGKPHFVHTLNGSGVAVGRALIAVMETYQQEDGSIAVPEVLVPYMGGVRKIERLP